MTKSIALMVVFTTLAFAKVLGGVSMLVDGEPITTYEIKEYQQTTKASLNDAVSALIQRRLEEAEIKKLGFVPTPYEIDQQMINMAKHNKLSLKAFKARLIKDGEDQKSIREKISKKIQKDRLYQYILSSKIKKPTEDELKRFYSRHKHKLSIPTKVDVIQYLSMDRSLLLKKIKTPSKTIEGVMQSEDSIELDKIPQGLAMIITQTQVGDVTQPFDVGDGRVVALKITKRYGDENIAYKDIKSKLAGAYLKEREQAILIEYFEKKKSEANIKIVRKPQ
jgi:hypothetical protein